MPDIGVRKRADPDRRLSGLPENDVEAAQIRWLLLMMTKMIDDDQIIIIKISIGYRIVILLLDI